MKAYNPLCSSSVDIHPLCLGGWMSGLSLGILSHVVLCKPDCNCTSSIFTFTFPLSRPGFKNTAMFLTTVANIMPLTSQVFSHYGDMLEIFLFFLVASSSVDVPLEVFFFFCADHFPQVTVWSVPDFCNHTSCHYFLCHQQAHTAH